MLCMGKACLRCIETTHASLLIPSYTLAHTYMRLTYTRPRAYSCLHACRIPKGSLSEALTPTEISSKIRLAADPVGQPSILFTGIRKLFSRRQTRVFRFVYTHLLVCLCPCLCVCSSRSHYLCVYWCTCRYINMYHEYVPT